MAPAPAAKVHCSKGAWCGGEWIDIEDLEKMQEWTKPRPKKAAAPRANADGSFDVAIVGAGCIGLAIARELSKYDVSACVLERDDDVTQGATKGNSGIVHAGFDDAPGSNRAKFCWAGNQQFPQLDKELRFGFLRNGSLVLARCASDEAILEERLARGVTNGVRNLRIVQRKELLEMEPHLGDDVVSALWSPDAGTVTPYEYAIALAENAADNGVCVKTRHEVKSIDPPSASDPCFTIRATEWPAAVAVAYDPALRRIFSALPGAGAAAAWAVPALAAVAAAALAASEGAAGGAPSATLAGALAAALVLGALAFVLRRRGAAGGSGGTPVAVRATYVVNAAGLFSDKVAKMVGDTSFTIKPRIGDYILLHKNQGHLARATLFPAPDPVKGKGVLVQTTLWGNLILGPTARDIHKPEDLDMTKEEIMRYVLTKCRELVPALDAGAVIHTFAGARAKSDRGDWIIEESPACKGFFQAAGIDSPGLAGSPAIAGEVVRLLHKAGLSKRKNKDFDPNRAPIVAPKKGWSGLKMGKADDASIDPAKKVICRCELVTEAEIAGCVHRSLRVDNTQAVRRRTRAGMGHCQGGAPTHCELEVAKILARENRLKVKDVGRRPWPATSILPKRWVDDADRAWMRSLAE